MRKDETLKHRKASSTLRVVDKAGNPVAGKKLTLRQTRHEFLFGCGAFDFLALTSYLVVYANFIYKMYYNIFEII